MKNYLLLDCADARIHELEGNTEKAKESADEPRLLKHRPKHFAFLRKPRHVIKADMAKRVR